jgi:hypothetical protein
MKRSVIAATALVGIATIVGASSAPAVAPAESSVAPTMHTRNLVLHENKSHNFGPNSFGGTDIARSARSHKIVGFDSFTGHFNGATSEVTIQVALSLKGGIIVGRVKGVFQQDGPPVLRGPITKGSGKYAGVDGRITARLTNSPRTFLTLKYQL